MWCESGAPPLSAVGLWAAFGAAVGLGSGWVVCSCRRVWRCGSGELAADSECIVCGELFVHRHRGGAAKTCSERCSHERRLQTAAAYRDRVRCGQLVGVGA